MTVFYKIRHKKTGKFSTGGWRPSWTKSGKVWNEIHHLQSHLREGGHIQGPMGAGCGLYSKYKDSEIVKFELNELEAIPVVEEVERLRARQVDLDRQRAEREAKEKVNYHERRLEEAKRLLRSEGIEVD